MFMLIITTTYFSIIIACKTGWSWSLITNQPLDSCSKCFKKCECAN